MQQIKDETVSETLLQRLDQLTSIGIALSHETNCVSLMEQILLGAKALTNADLPELNSPTTTSKNNSSSWLMVSCKRATSVSPAPDLRRQLWISHNKLFSVCKNS